MSWCFICIDNSIHLSIDLSIGRAGFSAGFNAGFSCHVIIRYSQRGCVGVGSSRLQCRRLECWTA